jgi:hypothetical protein
MFIKLTLGILGSMFTAFKYCAGAFLALVLVVACNNGYERYSKVAENATAPAKSTPSEQCATQLPNHIAEYDRLIAAKQYWDAYLKLSSCADLLGRSDLKDKVKEADILERQAIINNQKSTPREKANAMEVLARDYPEQFSGLAPKAQELTKKLDSDEKKRIKAERRKYGVSIGMTMEEVQDSSWGKPQSINRSIYANTTREQWVYGGRNYLYFDNGVLTSIQN